MRILFYVIFMFALLSPAQGVAQKRPDWGAFSDEFAQGTIVVVDVGVGT